MDLWAYQNGVKIDFSRPGKPTDNAYIESFNGTLRADVWTRIVSPPWKRPKRGSKPGEGNTMRAVLTGLLGRGHRTNSPMRSRLLIPA
jgi:transposase InsO family protein